MNLEFTLPNFNDEVYLNSPDITTSVASTDAVAPKNFYLTSHAPTFYKVNGKWQVPKTSSLNCVAVLINNEIIIKELIEIKKGDKIVVGHLDDGSIGILKYAKGFPDWIVQHKFRTVESSSTNHYNTLFKLMENEKNNDGYILWVLGPAVVFDHDTRESLSNLARNGYVNSILGGNAMATHDLEGGYLNTALGQDIYTQESMPMGHYNHLDLLNEVRKHGSIKNFLDTGKVKDGFIKTLYELDIPITLAGSVRDDGPLPEVEGNMELAITNAKKETQKATLIISLATMLHSISTAKLASSYRVDEKGKIKPIFFYTIDVTENAVNKVVSAREGIAVHRIITNVQDFVVNLERKLVNKERE